MASWTGTGEVVTRSGRTALSWQDWIVVGMAAFVFDLAATVMIGLPTAVGGIECVDTGCLPKPAQVIHTAALGLGLMIAAAAVPVVLAVVLRRAIVAVLIIQLVLGAGMVAYAGSNLSAAHDHLSEICHNAPELAYGECPPR